MPYRICLISLGCAKNQVNSEQMLYLLNQAGHDVVGEVDGCDVAIVNTCGFIDTAKSEAIDQILQLAEVKKAGALKRSLWPAVSRSGTKTTSSRAFRRWTACSARAASARSVRPSRT